MGYNLIIVKKDTVKNPAIDSFVLSVVPGAKCISNVAAEVAFQLPLQEVPKFKDLFLGLDNKLSDLKIASYGISITTLEEVFLRVAEGEGEAKNLAVNENNNGDPANNEEFPVMNQKEVSKEEFQNKVDDFDLNSVKIKGRLFLFFVHFWALFIKRWNYFKRDKKGLFCEVLLPCAIIGVGLCITLIQFIYTSPSLIMDPSTLQTPMITPVQNIGFFDGKNFNQKYFNFMKYPGPSNDLSGFDIFAFNQRNEQQDGLYGGLFFNSTSPSSTSFSYTAFVFSSFILLNFSSTSTTRLRPTRFRS